MNARARPATVEDIVRIAPLARGLGRDPEARRRWVSRVMDGVLEHPEERGLWVAEVGADIAGYARAARFEPPPGASPICAPAGWYLTGLMVAPAFRGRGIATLLTDVRMAWFREQGATCAYYFRRRDNLRSKAAHDLRYGFSIIRYRFDFPGVRGLSHCVLLRASL